MRIAIPTDDPSGLDAVVSMNFARAPFITLVDADSMTTTSHLNPYSHSGGGVGPMVAQWVASLGASAVVAPSIGPNAIEALTNAGLVVYSCPPGVRVREVVDMLKRGQLPPMISQSYPGPGVGPGGPVGGMGWGRGGWGRGRRKRGRGRGWLGYGGW